MKFTLDASGAQAAGSGIGNLFKAALLGPQVRQQAEEDAALKGAKTYAANMAGNKYGADAALDQQKLAYQQKPLEQTLMRLGIPLNQAGAVRERMETGSFGPSYEMPADGFGPQRPAPVDAPTMTKIGEYLAAAQRMYGTGSNVDQAAAAELKNQQGGYIDRVVADPGQASRVGQAYAAIDGKPLFDAVGTTGQTMNRFSGQAGAVNDVLAKLFGAKTDSEILENKASANSSNASAGNSSASARQTNLETKILETTGAKPGSGAEGSEGALSSTILKTLQIPAVDDKGRTVRNPITGEVETVTDQAAQKAFYSWVNANGKRPTAKQFADWEALGRPAGKGEAAANPKPAPTPAAKPGPAGKMPEAPEKPQRKAGTVYNTPKGPMKWTGTGWLPTQ